MKPTVPKRFYSRAEFARATDLSTRTIDRLIADGKIPAVKPTPRRVLIPVVPAFEALGLRLPAED